MVNTTTQKTLVVNVRTSDYDVYIGRRGHGQDGYFGNPFTIGREHTREQAIRNYETYFYDRIRNDHEFRARVLELRGKRLGCFCAPRACHGDVIAHYLDSTCADCKDNETCKYAFDGYNTNGDCLASK